MMQQQLQQSRMNLVKRMSDDNSSESSSSSSSLKAAAASFVSSLSSKSWVALSRKMKASTPLSEKNDSIVVFGEQQQQQQQHQQAVSKTGSTSSMKKSSAMNTPNVEGSDMDCSPQMIKNKVHFPNLNINTNINCNSNNTESNCNSNSQAYVDSTASSVTLASSSSLSMISSSMLVEPFSVPSARMDVVVDTNTVKNNINGSSNSTSSLVGLRETIKNASASEDVNGRVESLVNRALSSEAIKVIHIIASKFDSLSRTNANDPTSNLSNKTLMFSGRKEPSVTLNAFLLRLVTLLNWVFDKNSENGKGLNSTGMRYLVISTLYIERAMNLNPDLKITPLNIHRIFLGATVNAMTFFEDQIPDKTIMAKIGGVDEKQVRILGKRFFQCMDCRLWINPSDYILYYKSICESSQISFEPEIPSWQL